MGQVFELPVRGGRLLFVQRHRELRLRDFHRLFSRALASAHRRSRQQSLFQVLQEVFLVRVVRQHDLHTGQRVEHLFQPVPLVVDFRFFRWFLVFRHVLIFPLQPVDHRFAYVQSQPQCASHRLKLRLALVHRVLHQVHMRYAIRPLLPVPVFPSFKYHWGQLGQVVLNLLGVFLARYVDRQLCAVAVWCERELLEIANRVLRQPSPLVSDLDRLAVLRVVGVAPSDRHGQMRRTKLGKCVGPMLQPGLRDVQRSVRAVICPRAEHCFFELGHTGHTTLDAGYSLAPQFGNAERIEEKHVSS